MALDFSVDEFAFSDAVFDDFLKDLDEDNRTQKNVDLTFKGKRKNLHEFVWHVLMYSFVMLGSCI